MNSPNPDRQHVDGPIKNLATPSVITIPEQTRAGSAANEAATTVREDEENPLWIMAIALMVFCGVAAILIAFG